jgi:oligopeptidase B
MPSFPIAPKRHHDITQHGVTRDDEYYWMRESNDPEVLKYLEAENEYLEEILQHTKPLQETLFQEMKDRIKEDDSTEPEVNGEYYYYRRTEKGLEYPIYCRRKGTLDAPEEVLLDQNALADGHEFCSVSAFSVSPDGTKLAYSLDLEGSEVYNIHIKNLVDGSHYPEVIENTNGSVYFSTGVEWANDSQTFFYVTLDAAHRAYKLYRHQLGADPASDVLLLHEEDETYSLWIFKTRSGKYIMSYHYNTLSQEMHAISADEPYSKPLLLQARQRGLEYYATHHGDSFLVITNKDALNSRLMKAPVSSPGMESWQEILPHRSDVLLEHMDVFQDYIVLHERKNGLKQLHICRANDIVDSRYVSFPDPTYEVWVDQNWEFDSHLLRIRYSSLVTPPCTVDFHMDSGEWEMKKQDEVPSGYDRKLYATEFFYAPAEDGKRIPISIIYKKGLKKNGRNPALLYGYGAYGAPSDASFNTSLFSLIDRGYVFAIGHVRGGSELGREWYDDGRLLNKKNSFTDFIACAEHLIREGFTTAEKLAIIGSSAGGLLVGACLVMRPDLFGAVICKVPYVDGVTSMSDPTLPLTTLEYDQWGNPNEDRQAFEYMLSYSPYDNIQAADYPDVLLTTGFNDPRVAYWEPAKFAARLRDRKTGDGLVMLQTNFSAGHAGASGRYDYLKENMLDFAFLIDRLGTGD